MGYSLVTKRGCVDEALMLLLMQETRLRVFDGCMLMLATAPIRLDRPGLGSIQKSSQTSSFSDMQVTQHL